ncbi:hypothetical protein BXZ70DRAFT_942728 [Cristinia sonorae]|uniref:Uncharacterized protein n=1 Tax=Cristinia sonorae TaxID=1940300 RepID=A0A8K0UMI4_9AGAR|nr:hypothetical protein BXZ70DRAFT_942728 [Cristinia sonorae]
MDPNVPHHLNTTPNSRKRSRENETSAQRHKREKAAERQRRKRERDRQAGLNNILSLAHVQQQQQPLPPHPEPPVSAPPVMQDYNKPPSDDSSPEDMVRRERMRAAARERQRKHRALVKQRKLRELGLDMGNEIIPPMDDVQYRMNAPPDNQYAPVMPHEMQPPPPPHPHQQHPHPMHEPPFPQGQPLGGQTFASTLLLSFSCAPLLKAHLLRNLSMTNEELASLEPIIASAWDQWDQQRRMHYAHHPANAPKPPDGSNVPDQSSGSASAPSGYGSLADHASAQGTMQPSASSLSNAASSMSSAGVNPFATSHDSNDFRARFHRPLIAPSPFRSAMEATHGGPNGVVEGTQGDTGLDPHLTTKSGVVLAMDAQLGQAREEAASVAGKLDR